MNLLAPIEKWITEHGSAAILKERLDLLRDQIASIERENSELAAKLRLAKAKIIVLEAENEKLKLQIEASTPKSFKLEE